MDGTRGGPVVVSANGYRFRAHEQISHRGVLSACLLWVHSGSGTVSSGGASHQLVPGTALWLPWGHDVSYVPQPRTPFHLGTVHVVPWHQLDLPVVPRVAHQPGDPLLAADHRRGSGTEQSWELPAGSAAALRLAALGSYVVDRFADLDFDESVFRQLGELLMDERSAWASGQAEPHHPGRTADLPAAVSVMTEFILAHLDRAISPADVALAGGCSTATAQRLFTRWTGASVAVWIRRARLRQAAVLLRTSGLRVGEVAAAVGITDPLYFSRIFRQHHGVPPSRYARDELRP